MKLFIKLILTALAAILLAYWLPGVSIDGIGAALTLAVVLGILRLIVRPVLIILTLPITLLTLGLFLFVINGIIILMADSLIPGFSVSSFGVGILFSLLLSVFQSVLYTLFIDDR
jgi:putative membrane protein